MVRPQEKIDKAYVYFISVAAAVGTFLFGYHFTVIAGALIFVQKQFALTPPQLGSAVSSLYIGGMIGPIILSVLGDRLGRKKVLFLTGLLYALGAAGTALARNMIEFSIFRVVSGLGVGFASLVVPMYIAEVSPARMRGSLGCLSTFGIVVGAASSIIVAYYLSFTESWRWMFGLALIPAIVFLLGLTFIPESPRWLAQKDRDQEAYSILARINGEETAKVAMSAIKESLQWENGSWSELFRPGIRMALIIALGLAFFQQATGMGPTILYAAVILQKAGFAKATDAIFQVLLLNLWQVLLTIPAVLFTDRAGRKPLLLIGSAGLAISQTLFGAFIYYHSAGKFILVALLMGVGFIAFSLAPVGWLIISEIFPTRIRAKGQAVATAATWVVGFLLAQLFPPVMAYLDKTHGSSARAFGVFGFMGVLSLVFCWRVVPETKGKTLEEIAQVWLK